MAPSDPRAPRGVSPNRRAAAEAESRRLWRLTGMGGTLASEIAAGALIGWLLDLWLDTSPTLLIICTIAGMVVGIATFTRSALVASRQSQRDAERVAAKLRDEAEQSAAEERRREEEDHGEVTRDGLEDR